MMNRSVCGGGSMAGQLGALDTDILVLQALHMMNQSMCGPLWGRVHGGPAQGPGD
jgi:hypothetical protein